MRMTQTKLTYRHWSLRAAVGVDGLSVAGRILQ